MASAVLSSGVSYIAARRLKAFMIMHMGLVKTIKSTNIIFCEYKYPQDKDLKLDP